MTYKIDENLMEQLLLVIREKLELGADTDLRITNIEFDPEEHEVYFQLIIGANADPADVGKRFFGLPRRVNNVLAEKFEDFSARITPEFMTEANA